MNPIPEIQKLALQSAENLVFLALKKDSLETHPHIVSLLMMSEFDAVIESGPAPVIKLNYNLFLNFFNESDDKLRRKLKLRINRVISLCVSKFPRMIWDLSHSPVANMLAIREGESKIYKTNNPDKFIFRLPDSSIDLVITYTVSAREIHTGESVTLSGDNLSYLREKAIVKLTSLVEMNEILAEQLISESSLEIPPVHSIKIKETPIGPEFQYSYTPDMDEQIKETEKEIDSLLDIDTNTDTPTILPPEDEEDGN